jgi:hypothetical protein
MHLKSSGGALCLVGEELFLATWVMKDHVQLFILRHIIYQNNKLTKVEQKRVYLFR